MAIELNKVKRNIESKYSMISSIKVDGNSIAIVSKDLINNWTTHYKEKIIFKFRQYDKDRSEYAIFDYSGVNGVLHINGYGYTNTLWSATREDYVINNSDIENFISKHLDRKKIKWN